MRGRQLLFEHETSLFILVSALDLLMTGIVLSSGRFREANPLARWFLDRWGVQGMVYFKFALITFVCLTVQLLARHRPRLGKLMLQGAVAVTSLVVIYGLVLLLKAVIAA